MVATTYFDMNFQDLNFKTVDFSFGQVETAIYEIGEDLVVHVTKESPDTVGYFFEDLYRCEAEIKHLSSSNTWPGGPQVRQFDEGGYSVVVSLGNDECVDDPAAQLLKDEEVEVIINQLLGSFC